MPETTTRKFAYVGTGGTGKTEFEIHGAECVHLARLNHPFADVSFVSAESAQALVDDEVATYQEQDQGWNHSDFRILPCAK